MRRQSGFALQSFNFGMKGRGQFHDQGFDVAHLILNRQHRDALRNEVVDQEVLLRRSYQKRGRPVLPQAAFRWVCGGNGHGRVQVVDVLIGNVFAPFTARTRVDAAQIQRRITGQQERGE